MAKKRKGEYEVGFARPPKKSQFKKGQSGNPKGRPKQSKDIASLFERLSNESVTIREGESLRQMSTWEATVYAQIGKAMQGDQSAFSAVMNQAKACGLFVADPVTSSRLRSDRPATSNKEWEEAARKQQDASKKATQRFFENMELDL
ncbi:MAG: hypothetical protein JRC77_04195 [Deltaproteobacteria bacterium]|nr:hypothetical protein [Deltaproteobacteria bacterium]